VEEVSRVTEPSLSDAVVKWTGWGVSSAPTRDDDYVERIGGMALVQRVKELETDFYQSTARHVVADIGEAARVAAAEFRGRHPDVGEDAVDALAWCYSYDFK
jgi:hypothetical protein